MSAGWTDSSALLAEIERWMSELAERGLRGEAELRELSAELAQSRGERLDLPTDAILVVLLCGPTAVGKSTLINTLAGAEISRPGLGATTSAAVIYLHEDDNPQRLFEYGREIGELARAPQTVVRHRRPELLHKVLIDTPDIDSVVRDHRALTGALVHAADLVLFVTTPERYRDMQAAQWVEQQSAQRAMAFVLNKWDRASVGLQWEGRGLVEADFRRVLAGNGFAESQMFKVSCVATGGNSQKDDENELPALRDWLERGINRSASAAIQDRRRVMAWGRLAAAIAKNMPVPISAAPWLKEAFEAFAGVRREAAAPVQTAAAEVAGDIGDRSVWPSSPGLFGTYARFLAWCAALRQNPWYNPLGFGRTAAAGDGETNVDARVPALPSAAFAAALPRLLAETVRRLRYRLIAQPLPLKAVDVQWDDELAQLAPRLAAVPAATLADVVATASKLSFRRAFGIAAIAGIELAILAVLGTALWQVGRGFVTAQYAQSGLIYSTVALVILLLLAGHMLANFFFPSLRRRFQAELARRLQANVERSCGRMETALQEHAAAIDRLAAHGRDIQGAIDRSVQSLRHSGDGAAIERLFGQKAPAAPQADPLSAKPPKPQPPSRRPARFE